MKPSVALARHRDEIRRIVAEHHAANVRVFGSVLRGEDQEGSDLDLLIDPTPDTTLMDLAAIRLELRTLLRVEVDVRTPRNLPERFRDSVLNEAIPL